MFSPTREDAAVLTENETAEMEFKEV